ncbi:MAG: UDP-N-acetylmuramoyl-L-alanyl-D-glutamate--2,6-diaminopimelate ligase [Acetatifactor sp.]|nr:UDP-N-acetylmuramoyl-L-alanyl-D-glutamate--2,6-diaminopimelate ligase [Acetatifactor sp.]
MILRELLKDIDHKCLKGDCEREVTAVVYDSRKVNDGCLFICIEGTARDGHDFAKEVVEAGAKTLVVSKDVPEVMDEDITVIKVADTRYAMALISAAWFSHPADHIKTIGITGTKGKTTTTYQVKSILENAGYKVGLIGTIEIIIGDKHIHAVNTTPESYVLQDYLRQMVDAGLDCVVMEVSSQALKMHRSAGIMFDFGIFTNLSEDHIAPGEHPDFADYLECKSRLFKQCRVGIVNGDDAYADDILKGHTCSVETYGFGADNMLRAEDVKLFRRGDVLGVSFDVRGLMDFPCEVPLPGRFSVYNALTSIAICRHFNADVLNIENALKNIHVKGRIEPVKVSDDFTLLIDYAHNAMSLESLLSTLKEYEPKRLVCLFGCGGNRAKSRRYEMGEVSGRLADLTIITTDNPRFEEPEDIIKDIITGIEKTGGQYVAITDRKEAIAYAIENGRKGDIVVLAGKGHEDYQEIRGVKYPMDERDLIASVLAERTEK